MKPTKKIPLEWELNFDQTEIKKLEKKTSFRRNHF